ncbi:hypothetical protein SALBM217S_07577 [Streptomyces griseoloalbus]
MYCHASDFSSSAAARCACQCVRARRRAMCSPRAMLPAYRTAAATAGARLSRRSASMAAVVAASRTNNWVRTTRKDST